MARLRRSLRCRKNWQSRFLRMLPTIERYVRPAFRDLRTAEREDAVQEAIGQAFLAYVRLMRRGRQAQIFATVLARYAIMKVRAGRSLGTPQNSRDVLSRVAQRRRGFHVKRLHDPAADVSQWREAVLEDLQTPVPDQAAFRIDYPTWLSRMSSRDRRITEALAAGHSTQEVACKFRLSPGRISQLRRELQASWEEFHDGMAAVTSSGARNVPRGVDLQS